MLHTGEPHPSNFAYAYSKRMLEVGSRCLKLEYNINSNCLVPCNLYGKNDNYDIENGHVIPSLIHKCYKSKLTGEDFVIWGSGNAEREFMYANDLADIITNIHKNQIILDSPMIVSPDNIYTIREIVETIIKLMKFDGKVIFDASKPEGIMKKNTLNNTFKGYFPDYKFTPLDEGLAETIEYFIKNYDYLRK
jgi:GDP-L-fucose synthase